MQYTNNCNPTLVRNEIVNNRNHIKARILFIEPRESGPNSTTSKKKPIQIKDHERVNPDNLINTANTYQ